MAFTEEQKRLIREALAAKLPNPVCPMCHQTEFFLADDAVILPMGKNVWGKSSYSALPCISIICATCGNTLLYNINILGLHEALKEHAGEMDPGPPTGVKNA